MLYLFIISMPLYKSNDCQKVSAPAADSSMPGAGLGGLALFYYTLLHNEAMEVDK